MFFYFIICIFIFINIYKWVSIYFEEFISYLSLFLLNQLGFKVNLESLKYVPNKSIIIMSHTSIYDFVICSMIYHVYFKKRLNIYFMMKEEFGTPANDICIRFFPYMRIIPIGSTHNIVQKVVEELKDSDHYALSIAPEGTRRVVEDIRTGFYYIARQLNVPVVYCGIDFATKDIYFEKGRKMGSNIEEEKIWFGEMCQKYTPLYPENCYYTTDYYRNNHISSSSPDYFEGVNPMNTIEGEGQGVNPRRYNIQIIREENDDSTHNSTNSYDSYISNIDSYHSN